MYYSFLLILIYSYLFFYSLTLLLFRGPFTQIPNKSLRGLFFLMNAQPQLCLFLANLNYPIYHLTLGYGRSVFLYIFSFLCILWLVVQLGVQPLPSSSPSFLPPRSCSPLYNSSIYCFYLPALHIFSSALLLPNQYCIRSISCFRQAK